MPADGEIVNGPPGVVWVNRTGRVRYQFVSDLVRTCGVCLQYHLAIGVWWGIPVHRGCRCQQLQIAPGAAASHAFLDFRELLAKMSPARQAAAVGAGNYRLLKAGVVDWADVVTATRVRSLREVMAGNGITAAVAVDAGVRRAAAELAVAAGPLTEEELEREARGQLVDRFKSARVSQDELAGALGRGLAVAAAIAGGVGFQTTPAAIAAVPHAAELVAALEVWRRPGRRRR
jgi:hypothetical protein